MYVYMYIFICIYIYIYIYIYTHAIFQRGFPSGFLKQANPSSRSEKWGTAGDHQRAAALAGGGSPHWLCAAGCSGGRGDWVDRARSPGGNLWGSKGTGKGEDFKW